MLQFSIITITSFVTMLNDILIYIMKTYFNYDIKKYVPLFSLLFGLILGITGYFLTNVDMGENIVEAIFIGLSAGSTATGLDQIGKQLSNDY